MPTTFANEVKPGTEAFQLDEAQFRARIPYALTPTSLKGVYLHPTPGEDFDPHTATQSELIKNGVMIRKPSTGDTPALQHAWDSYFSTKLLAKNRLVPEFHVNVGKTHISKKPAVRHVNGTSWLSDAWAGAVGDTGHWTTCIGTWKVPTVSKPSEAQGTEGGWNSSSWVGIDGFNDPHVSSNDVLQAGVEQRVDAHGNASYNAWYEWYAPPVAGSPAYVWEVDITNMAIHPGDSMSCTVQYVGSTSGSLTFVNNTTGVHFSITLAPPPGANFRGNTCEWIMEAPDYGEPTSSLPRFTPVVFSLAIACGPNNTSTNPALCDVTNVENASGRVLTATTVGTDTVTISFIG